MKFRKTFTYLTLAMAVLLSAAFTAYGSDNTNGKRITFTTKSKEAKEYVAEIVRSIESFRFGNEWLPLAQKAVAADPEFAFAHYLVATATPPPNAKPHADKAVELSKKASDAERRYIEAVLLTRAQKHDEAIAIFTDLARQYPEERMVQMMLGQVYMAKNNPDQARAHFENARKLDGSTPRVYTFLGNIHLIKGDYTKAREYFKTSLSKKTPGTAPGGPAYGLAFSHLYEGDLAGALKTLEAYQVEYANTPGAKDFPPVFVWNSIGRLLLENGRAAESIKAYETGYATVPASNLPEQEKKVWLGRLHHGKGRALAKMGKHEEAWKEAEMIKKMIDEGGEQGQQFMPAYHYIVGYLKLESGDYAKAVEHLKQSDLNDPFHKLLLARAYEKSGDEASAQKLYKEIVAFPFNSMERALSYPEAKKKAKA
ncbi:MAG TPA: tetratricopeptide repeat protein [Blastocatellia bacterium]|nr:tetratricopeptide repeat protein [Blastocatellia bacterium]